MMGENPIFLFDAAYETLTARPADGTVPAETTRVCYFIPDAHHSIPFVRVVESGEPRPRYVAPPHIDAMMTVDDGTFDQQTGEWTVFPSTVSIWLHSRTVRYQVQIQKNADGSLADVPVAEDGISLHASPASTTARGTGMPGWGRVERIEDRYGNRVLLEYAEDRYRVIGPVTGTSCHYVHQNSNERSQLKAARLVAAASADSAPTWTLFYLYRSFRSIDLWGENNGHPYPLPVNFFVNNPYAFPYHRQNAVIAVYAYRGNQASPSGSLTLDAKYFEAIRPGVPNPANLPLESGDPDMPAGPTGEEKRDYLRRAAQMSEFARLKFGLSTDWTHRATYLYSDPDPECFVTNGGSEWTCNADSPRLLIAKTESRDTQESKDTSERVYRYAGPKIHGEHRLLDTLYLTHIYSGSELAAAIKAAKAAGQQTGLPWNVIADPDADSVTIATAWLDHYCATLDVAGTPVISSGNYGTPLYRVASRSYLRPGLEFDNPKATQPTRFHRVPTAVLDFLGATADQAAVMTYGGVEFFTASSASDPVVRTYRLQRLLVNPAIASLAAPAGPFENFRILPEGQGQESLADKAPQIGRALLHYPYRLILHPQDIAAPSTWLSAQPADQPTFIAVITGDEVPNTDGSVQPRSAEEKTNYIRVVQMNAAGVVIRDTYVPSDGESEPIDQIPTLEGSMVRDARGSVIERRSTGYHSKENLTPSTSGLIEVSVYDYAGYLYSPAQVAWNRVNLPPRSSMLSPPDVPVYTQLVARGFKYGNQTSSWYMTHFNKYHNNNPELLTLEVELATPILMSGPATLAVVNPVISSYTSFAADDAVQTHSYEFYSATQAAADGTPHSSGASIGGILGQPRPATTTLPFADYARVQSRTTLHGKVTDSGGNDLQLVEIERFDNAGRSTIAARGYRPWNSSNPPTVYSGALRLTDGAGNLIFGGQLADWPGSSGSSAALRPATASRTRKDRDGRPVRIDAPDGLATFILYRRDPDSVHRTIRVTYSDVDPATMTTKRPVLVEYVRGVNVEVEQGRILAGQIPFSPDALNISAVPATRVGDEVQPLTPVATDPIGLTGTGIESAIAVYEKRARRDGAGRLAELELVDPVTQSVLGLGIEHDAFGNMTRVRSTSGVVTRTVFDKVGRISRVFRGTTDQHEVWGTSMDPNNGPCTAVYNQDNMLLTTAQDYGVGVNDAGKPTVLRRPRTKATNQYELTLCDPPGPASTVNAIGLVERNRYDARMRDVWREAAASLTATPTCVNVTWLDGQNRVRFEAVFTAAKAALLGSLDPRTLSPSTLPTPAQILAKQPLRLTESLYDAQGRAIHMRNYDVAAVSAPRFTSVRSWYDHEDRVVRSESPTGTTVTTYDDRGRVSSMTELAGALEVRKTVYVYDDTNDTQTEELVLLRVPSIAGTAPLDASTNAVRTRTFHWYDSRENRIATVELGTENSANTFVSATPATRPTTSPCVYDGQGRLTGFSLSGVLDGGVAQCWEYDHAGRVVGTVATDSRVTRTVYNGLGQVVRVDENALGTDPLAMRTTEYRFDLQGRLALIAAGNKYFAPGTAWETNTDAQIRVTKLEYGAPVVTEGGAALLGASANSSGVTLTDPDSVWRVYLPMPATGRPATTASLEFKYLLTGEVYSRADLRRNTLMVFSHDDRGNLLSWTSDPGSMTTPPGGLAPDQVETVSYAYDALGRLTRAQATTKVTQGLEDVVADTEFLYDGRGNLSDEIQAHGKLVGFDTPKIEYTREYVAATASSAGKDRLTGIKYPNRDMVNGTEFNLAIGYGAVGSIDDALSRVASIGENGASRRLVDYLHAGTDTRIATLRGVLASSGVASSVERSWSDGFTGIGYDRLDRFGRTLEAKVIGSGTTPPLIWQSLVGYDAGGRRVSERISTGTTTTTDNVASWLYGYDGLSRLVNVGRGKLNTTNNSIETTAARRLNQWTFDPLGSWAGTSTLPGMQTTIITAGGATTTLSDTDVVNGHESITRRDRKVNAGTVVGTDFASDSAGNTQFDGRYVYQYDTLGRLVQVNQAGSVAVNSSGQLTGTAGSWVEHRTYDGLGRLIRLQAPWPVAGAPGGYIVSRRFYYEGDRRVARISTQPYASDGTNLGDPGKLKEEIDLEQEIDWLSATDRLWVWDASEVDRLVAVYGDAFENGTPSSPLARAWLTVTDLDGTPIALLDHASGNVVTRQGFDAQGGLVEYSRTHVSGVYPPRLEVGWKGLFAARLDDPLTDEVIVAEDGSSGAATGDGPALVYDVRARAYRPWLGRFLQQDPLGTGVPVRTGLRWHGLAPASFAAAAFDAGSHYRDGQHAMAFGGGNSIGRGDPTGLFFSVPGLLPNLIMNELSETHGNIMQAAGNNAAGMLVGLVNQYNEDQEMDFDWAMNWDAPDDMYTKSADAAMMTGTWGALQGLMDMFDDVDGEEYEGEEDGPVMSGFRPPRVPKFKGPKPPGGGFKAPGFNPVPRPAKKVGPGPLRKSLRGAALDHGVAMPTRAEITSMLNRLQKENGPLIKITRDAKHGQPVLQFANGKLFRVDPPHGQGKAKKLLPEHENWHTNPHPRGPGTLPFSPARPR